MNKQYYGTKKIAATPMNRQAYNDFRNWTLPNNENGADEGYLVEYLDGGKPNVDGFKGYVSWSPKEQFEAAYQENGKMSFGHALLALKTGARVSRAGWNGKGMWLSYSPGAAELPAERFWSAANKQFAYEMGGNAEVLPCITMKTADDKILMGWLASQTDMLAEDWGIVL